MIFLLIIILNNYKFHLMKTNLRSFQSSLSRQYLSGSMINSHMMKRSGINLTIVEVIFLNIYKNK